MKLIDGASKGEELKSNQIKSLELFKGIKLLEIGGVFSRAFADLFGAEVTTVDPTSAEYLDIKKEENNYRHIPSKIDMRKHEKLLGQEEFDFTCSVRLIDSGSSMEISPEEMLEVFSHHTAENGLSIHVGDEIPHINEEVLKKIDFQRVDAIEGDPAGKIPLSGITREEVEILRKLK